MPGRSPRHDRSPRPARAAPTQALGPPLRGLVVRAGRDTPAGGALGPRARRLAALLLLAALAAGAPGCATLPGFAADAQQACWPRFPYRDGWLGGDGAWSVPLSRTRSLWLFGDTFVGRPDQHDRVGAQLVHNSLGVSECRNGRFAIEYVWGRGPDGAPRAFLEKPDGAGWWWPFGGFLHEGALYLGLLEVEGAPPRGPLGLPFRLRGSALARVSNPRDPPHRWRIQILPLARDAGAHPVSAFAIAEPYLYLFGFLDRPDGRSPRILARLPLAALAARAPDLPGALETWAGAQGWLPGFRPDQAAIVMDDDATEMSVRHHPESGRWLALYGHPAPDGPFPARAPSDAIYLRSAPAPEGPWSERRLVFRVPELAPDGAAPPDLHTACYAAKEQPQFSRPGSLTFTYVCNLFAGPDQDPWPILARLQRRMELYRPIAASVTLPVETLGGRAVGCTLDPVGRSD
ncbi:MAG TPA: DUF4185 domain-containing protein [Myxococcota bacterium]